MRLLEQKNLSESNNAFLNQSGFQNEAHIYQNGGSNFNDAFITQSGEQNFARVNQSSNSSLTEAQIDQSGNNNQAIINLSGLQDSVVKISQGGVGNLAIYNGAP